jgi:aminotransferase
MPELRELISDKIQRDNSFNAEPSDIVITPGANQAFINILITITDPGDKIILLSPYYFNHAMACTLFGVDAIEVPLFDDFSIDYHTLENIIKGIKIKAIVLVNPGNPTGAVHGLDELNKIKDLILDTDILLIADETYEYFVYEGKHVSAASVMGDKVITIQSFSKTYGVPGWRLGYYHAKSDIIEASIKLQDTTVICAPAPSQFLGIELLNNRESMIPEFKKYLFNNYKLARDLIEEIDWMENGPSKGAYYFFPRHNTKYSSYDLSKKLILENKVYLVYGDAFGKAGEKHLRVSFANVTEEGLKESFSRLKIVL